MLTIKQLKEQYPQYADMDDSDLANRLYDKYYQNQIDKTEYLSKVLPQDDAIDSSKNLGSVEKWLAKNFPDYTRGLISSGPMEEVIGNSLSKNLVSDETVAKAIDESKKKMADIPYTAEQLKAFEQFGTAEGWLGVSEAVLSNPGTALDVVQQSLGSSTKGLVAAMGLAFPVTRALGEGAKALTPLLAVTFGSSSLATEYTQSYTDFMTEEMIKQGLNPDSSEDITTFLGSPDIGGVKEKALQRGIPIAVFDAMSAGIAGKFMLNKGMSLPARLAGEVAVQAGAGASGEVAAQLVSEGEIKSKADVILEGLAGIITGVPETVASVKLRGKGKEDDTPKDLDSDYTAEEEVSEETIDSPLRSEVELDAILNSYGVEIPQAAGYDTKKTLVERLESRMKKAVSPDVPVNFYFKPDFGMLTASQMKDTGMIQHMERVANTAKDLQNAMKEKLKYTRGMDNVFSTLLKTPQFTSVQNSFKNLGIDITGLTVQEKAQTIDTIKNASSLTPIEQNDIIDALINKPEIGTALTRIKDINEMLSDSRLEASKGNTIPPILEKPPVREGEPMVLEKQPISSLPEEEAKQQYLQSGVDSGVADILSTPKLVANPMESRVDPDTVTGLTPFLSENPAFQTPAQKSMKPRTKNINFQKHPNALESYVPMEDSVYISNQLRGLEPKEGAISPETVTKLEEAVKKITGPNTGIRFMDMLEAITGTNQASPVRGAQVGNVLYVAMNIGNIDNDLNVVNNEIARLEYNKNNEDTYQPSAEADALYSLYNLGQYAKKLPSNTNFSKEYYTNEEDISEQDLGLEAVVASFWTHYSHLSLETRGEIFPELAQSEQIQLELNQLLDRENDLLSKNENPAFVRKKIDTLDAKLRNLVSEPLRYLTKTTLGKILAKADTDQNSFYMARNERRRGAEKTLAALKEKKKVLEKGRVTNPNIEETAMHEAYHYIRDETDTFTESDKKLLEREFPRIAKFVADKTGLRVEDINNFNSNFSRSEVEATAFGLHSTNKENIGPVTAVFNKVHNLLRAIKNYFNGAGFRTFEDLFDNVAQGGRAENNIKKSMNKLSEIRYQQMGNGYGEAKIKSAVKLLANIPRLESVSDDFGDIERMDIFSRAFASMAHLAAKNRGIADIFNFEQSRTALIQDITRLLSTEMLPYVKQKEKFNDSMDILHELRDSDQKFLVNSKGQLVLKRNGKNIAIAKDRTDFIKGIQDVFKEVPKLGIKIARQSLGGYGLDPETTLSDLKKHAKEMQEAGDKDGTAINRFVDILEDMEGLIHSDAAYVPNKRFGDWGIVVKDSSKAKSDQVIGFYTVESNFKKHPDRKQLEEALKEIKSEFGGNANISWNAKPFLLTYDSIKGKLDERFITTELLASLLGSANSEQYSALAKKLKADATMPSIAKHFKESKNIKGYSKNHVRVAASYINGMSMFLGEMATGSDRARISTVAESIQNPITKDLVSKWLKYIHDPKADQQALRSFNFYYTMGGNVSTGLLQLLTPIVQSAAYATSYSGGYLRNQGRVAKNLTKAEMIRTQMPKDAFSKRAVNFSDRKALNNVVKKGLLTPEEADMIQKLTSRGRLQATLVEDQLGQEVRIREGKLGQLERGVELTKDFLSMPIVVAEQVSRIATALTLSDALKNPEVVNRAYEMKKSQDARFKSLVEMDKGLSPKEALITYGLDEIHAVFGKVSRPASQRGIWGSLIMPFMTHPQQMLELLIRQASKQGISGKRAFAYTLGAYVLLAGAYGIPGYNLLKEMYEAYKRITGDEIDLDVELQKTLVKDFGLSDEEATMVRQGVLRPVFNMDLAKRVSLPLSIENPAVAVMNMISPKNYGTGPVGNIAGVPGSFAQSVARAISDAQSGGTMLESAIQLMPIPVKNLYEGTYVYPTEGAKTATGKLLVSPEEITEYESIMKAIGINPGTVARAREQRRDLILQNYGGNRGHTMLLDKLGQIAFDMKRAGQKSDSEALEKKREEYKSVYKQLIEFDKENGRIVDSAYYDRIKEAVNDRIIGREKPNYIPGLRKNISIYDSRRTFGMEE